MKRVLLFTATLLWTPLSWPHGGDDHDHGVTPLAAGAAPRAAAGSEDFELVAVLAGAQLTVYLDRLADNAPVAGAAVEVESGAFKAVARETSPAVYVLPASAFAKPGRYPLTFTVQAGESADLLTATLEIPPPPAPGERRNAWDGWAAAAGFLAVAAGLLAGARRLLRRRRGKE